MGRESEHAQVSKQVIHNLLDSVYGSHANFKGEPTFYDKAGINCRRWAKLYRGELSITLDELKWLCLYLKVEFTAETFARQLKMFD